MWKSKKVILVTLLVVGILAGTIAGVALAQTGNTSTTDQSQTKESRDAALLDKVVKIYQEKTGVAIDSQALKDAFAQAQKETLDEALQSRLQNLVEKGKITQEQADQYKQWWQARPDTPLPLGKGLGGGMMGRGGPRGCW